MKKWKIGCIVVLVVVGLLIWASSLVVVRAPRGGVIHIQTPGGPVPIKLVAFDSEWIRLEFGYQQPDYSRALSSGRRGDFEVAGFAYSPLRIELNFPRSNATLKVEEVIDDEGKKRLEGYWTQTEENAAVKKLQATQLHSMTRGNWFDEASEYESDEPEGTVDGRWSVEFEESGEKALLEIYQWTSMSGKTQVTIEAEFLSYHTTNRFYAGRVDGNRVRLASFENGIPVLIHAELLSDGTLKGDLWIGDWEHLSWTATKKPESKEP